MLVKYPKEFPRSQRSFKERNYFKANEYRNIAFYLLVGLFRNFLSKIYYENLVIYAIFIRILCDTNLTKNDIEFADELIHKFVSDYERLYGPCAMTYNLHAHLHLPLQVYRHGPLNKISSFGFENMFKICHTLSHGTRGLVDQIGFNLLLNKNIESKIFEKFGKKCSDLSKFLLEEKLEDKNCLIKPILIKFSELDLKDKIYIEQAVDSSIYSLKKSKKAILNSICKSVYFLF